MMMDGWQNGKDQEKERDTHTHAHSRFLENIVLIIKEKKVIVLSKIRYCCRDFWILEFGSRKRESLGLQRLLPFFFFSLASFCALNKQQRQTE